MQALAALIFGIARIAVSIGIIYLIYKIGKFLDVLPDILVKKKEEKQ